MDKVSFYTVTGLPQTFGGLLLTFAFILLLAPYFSGADFGLFKIPIFSQKAKKWLKTLGPVVFLLCAFLFLPVFPAGNKVSDAQIKSPLASPTTSSSPAPSLAPALSTSSPNLSIQKQEAEKLATDWFAALLRDDVDALVQMSDLPFYFDQEILVRQEDLRSRYQGMGAKQESPSKLKLQSIKVQTIAELKKSGYDTTRDRLLDSLHLDEDDFAITLMLSLEGLGSSPQGLGLYTRKRGKEIKLAGFWD